MDERNKITHLLDMQESPETLTLAELEQTLADKEMSELSEAMALGKRAMARMNHKMSHDDVEKEWKRFEDTYLSAANGTVGREVMMSSSRRQHVLYRYRTAALFAVLLVVSGVVLAAIFAVLPSVQKTAERQHAVSQTVDKVDRQDTAIRETDSLQAETVVFDNVTIENVLDEIAQRHNLKVVYVSNNSKSLRIYMKWNTGDSIEKVVNTLNMFEHIDIQLSNNLITVQ